MKGVWEYLTKSVARDWPSYVVICLGVALQLLLVTRSLDFLLTNLLPDDAFYYFEIARNIASGQGSTFDGVHATNGYHPLWLLTLVPIFNFFSVGGTYDIAPLYAALYFSVFVNALTSVAVLRLVARITQSRVARAFGLILWSLNPFILFETLNGLETSLALFFTALFFLAVLHVEAHDRLRFYFVSGCIAGVMTLARVDLAFYFIAFLGWVLVRHGLKEGARRAFIAGVPALLLVLPWLVWNITQFQMLLTSASGANPFVNHALTVSDNGTSLFASIKAVLYMLVTFGKDVLVRTGAPWLLFILLGSAVAFSADRAVKLQWGRKHLPLVVALFGGFCLLFLVNAGVRFTGRSWYFISANFFLVFAGVYLLKLFAQRHVRFNSLVAVLTLAVLASFFVGWYGTLRDAMANDRGMYHMALWMNEHLPADTPVGVFNAGIEGYFSHVRIVNLDGLVNNSAYDAMREYRLWSYIKEEQIPYIADFDIYLTYRYRSFLDVEDLFAELAPVVRVPVADEIHGSDEITLYQVRQGGK